MEAKVKPGEKKIADLENGGILVKLPNGEIIRRIPTIHIAHDVYKAKIGKYFVLTNADGEILDGASKIVFRQLKFDKQNQILVGFYDFDKNCKYPLKLQISEGKIIDIL